MPIMGVQEPTMYPMLTTNLLYHENAASVRTPTGGKCDNNPKSGAKLGTSNLVFIEITFPTRSSCKSSLGLSATLVLGQRVLLRSLVEFLRKSKIYFVKTWGRKRWSKNLYLRSQSLSNSEILGSYELAKLRSGSEPQESRYGTSEFL